MCAYFSLRPSFLASVDMALAPGSAVPVEGELVVGLGDVAGEGDEVDVELLQVEAPADPLLDGVALDGERALRVDLDQGRQGLGARVGVVVRDGLDDGARLVVLLEGDEDRGHGG